MCNLFLFKHSSARGSLGVTIVASSCKSRVLLLSHSVLDIGQDIIQLKRIFKIIESKLPANAGCPQLQQP